MLQLNYYVIPLIIGILVSIGFIVYAIKAKPTFNYKLLVIIAVGGIIWLICNLLDVISTDKAIKIFWNHISYLGVFPIVIGLFIFTSQYAMGKKWITVKNIIALSLFPFIYLVLDFTNKYHWLVVQNYRMELINGNVFLIKDYGPLFWVWTIYAYLLIIISFFLLIKMLIISLRYYKWHSLLLIIATTIPIYSNIMYLSGAFSFSYYDTTPIALVLSIMLVLYGTTRLKIGDLIYFTRDSVFENLKDGILLLNSQNRIVDYNSVAENIFGDVKYPNYRGKMIEEVWKGWEKYDKPVPDRGNHIKEIALEEKDSKKVYELRTSYFYDYKKKLTSRLINFRDITERKEAEEKIIYLSFHDKLTGLYNRAYFEEELRRLDTDRQLPLSFIIGDVNGLKLVNDAFGHSEGDKILVNIAKILKENCRKHDILARYGGDEFALLLPCTDQKTAEDISKRIKEACNNIDEQKIPLSLSLGMATKTKSYQDINTIIRNSEEQMYQNKLLEKKSNSDAIISHLEKSLLEKSNETPEHAERLNTWALEIGNKLGLQKNKLDELELLSGLHDIGMIAIPDSLINKKEKLTEDDWNIIKKHPGSGHNIAESVNRLTPIAEAILCHHEWWNGGGYPYGLKGKDIPITSRIIAVIDAYDVMRTGRTYKEAINEEEALKELKRLSGIQFDPEIVDLFIDFIKDRSIKR